jgi:hypothetical protein
VALKKCVMRGMKGWIEGVKIKQHEKYAERKSNRTVKFCFCRLDQQITGMKE